MNPYFSTIRHIVANAMNMPDPETQPGKWILWAEDIAQVLAHAYHRDYDTVCEDLANEAIGGEFEAD